MSSSWWYNKRCYQSKILTFKCQNIAHEGCSNLIKVVCAGCAGSQVESSKCGQRSTTILLGPESAELRFPLCIFNFFLVSYLICKPPSYVFWTWSCVIWNGARAGLHLNQTKQISTIVFSNALVEMLIIKLGDSYTCSSEVTEKQNKLQLHVFFKHKIQHCMC